MIKQLLIISVAAVLGMHASAMACGDCPESKLTGTPAELIAEALRYRDGGQLSEARARLAKAAAGAQSSGDVATEIAARAGLGEVLAMMRDHEAAGEQVAAALELAKGAGDALAEARALNNLGIVQSIAREAGSAATFIRAGDLARQAGDNELAVRAELNAAMSGIPTADAASCLRRAQNGLTRVSAERQPMLAVGLGRAWMTRGDDDATARAVLEAVVQDASADDLARSYALGYLAEIAAKGGDRAEALRLARRGAFAAQAAQSPDGIYRRQWQIGRLLAGEGQIDAAVRAYSAAVESLQAIRGDVALGYGNAMAGGSFREAVGPLYFELADLLLRQVDQADDPATREALLRAAREAVERFKSTEMAEYWRDECVSQLVAQQVGIERLADDTAVIYFIPLADRTEILVETRGVLERFVAVVSADQLAEAVHLLRRRLQDRTTERYLTPSRQIYDWLIRPIESYLDESGVSTLVFVPDGALRGVPMATLQDGQRFLIEKFAIAVSPGLTLTDPQPIGRHNMQLLISGLSESRHGLPGLDFVPAELERIETIFGGRTLLDEAFVTPVFAGAVRDAPFTIVHIASHGEFKGNAAETFLATWDQKLSLDALQRIIQPNLFKGQPVELLCLSACQTAAGDDRAALGLAGVAIKSGARSAMATLWSVNDQASADLVAAFYRTLRDQPTISKAEALRQAQQSIMAQPRYQHPAYWSPYLIIGNWL